MAILKIARLGHPVLRTRATPVGDPADAEVVRLLADMAETMLDAGGVGLAAPQVHVPLRVIVWRAPDGVAALLNPVLEVTDPTLEEGWEGCLSIPGLRGRVPRARAVRFSGMDATGASFGGEAAGFAARVLQHEHDHLEGIVYPMRMTDLSQLGFTEELARAEPPALPSADA